MTPAMPCVDRPTSSRCGRFTILELSMSLLIVAIVAGGVASLLLGMSQHWKDTQDTQAVLMAATAISSRLQQELSSARQIGFVRPQPANPSEFAPGGGVLLWMEDGGDGFPADGRAQISELALIQQEWVALPGGTGKTPCVVLYRTGQSVGSGADYSAVFDGTGDGDIGVAFAEICRNVHGVEPIVLGVNVTELAIEVDRQGARPLARFEFVVQRDGRSERRVGAATLSAPLKPPGD
jgi:type II secretory pathway pseudopilin PulG